MLQSKFTGQALFKLFIEFLRENTGKIFIIAVSTGKTLGLEPLTILDQLMKFMLTMTDIRFFRVFLL